MRNKIPNAFHVHLCLCTWWWLWWWWWCNLFVVLYIHFLADNTPSQCDQTRTFPTFSHHWHLPSHKCSHTFHWLVPKLIIDGIYSSGHTPLSMDYFDYLMITLDKTPNIGRQILSSIYGGSPIDMWRVVHNVVGLVWNCAMHLIQHVECLFCLVSLGVCFRFLPLLFCFLALHNPKISLKYPPLSYLCVNGQRKRYCCVIILE